MNTNTQRRPNSEAILLNKNFFLLFIDRTITINSEKRNSEKNIARFLSDAMISKCKVQINSALKIINC